MMSILLKPAFAELEVAVASGEPQRIDAAYGRLLEGCNACRRGAERPFIVIERNRDNPYPQRFAPGE